MGKPHKNPSFCSLLEIYPTCFRINQKFHFKSHSLQTFPLVNSHDDQNVVIEPFQHQLISKVKIGHQPRSLCVHTCAMHCTREKTSHSLKYNKKLCTRCRKIMKQWSNSKVKKAWQSPSLPEYTRDYQNCQWCVIYWIHLELARANNWSWNGNGCVALSLHSKVASCLPGLGHWVPWEDRGEVVVNIITTGDEEDIADQVACSPSLGEGSCPPSTSLHSSWLPPE